MTELNLKGLTQEQVDEAESLFAKFGARAAQAYADSVRATDAFNSVSGGEFTAEAWGAGIRELFS